MKKSIYYICLLSLSALVIADDTEIYGTDGNDDDSRVNANVLFIMDNSGSMDAKVDSPFKDYDPEASYGSNSKSVTVYDIDKFYHDENSPPANGHRNATLTTSDSTDCTTHFNNLKTKGKSQGKDFKQFRYRNGNGQWKNFSNDWSDSDFQDTDPVRCDTGSSKTLYSGNYLNWLHYYQDDTQKTRLKVVVDVVKDLTESLENVNLGLMRFDYDQGGMIDIPIGDISTTGQDISDKLDTYTPSTWTPLTEVLYEAGLYFRGDTWNYGSTSSPKSDAASVSGTKYITPMEASCQKNHIILLTDGEPSEDVDADSEINTLVRDMSNFPESLSKLCGDQGTIKQERYWDWDLYRYAYRDVLVPDDGQCLDELAYWLQNTDHSDKLSQTQNITVHTIGGFDLTDGVALLQNTALQGGGSYYPADDGAELILALDSIFLKIFSTDTTFTAPAVSVNAFNTSEHRDELFYALFSPDDNIKWDGNLKKYKLSRDGTVLSKDESTAAINNSTGFFDEEAQGFWNPDDDNKDGAEVSSGGMANLLNFPLRSVYTETLAGDNVPLITLRAGATATSFSSTDAELENLVNWAYGENVISGTGANRYSIGDPLHSEPLIVTYGGTDENPDSTIFFGTNEGYIHAVDTESGQEEFAFLPQALHDIQKDYYENTTAASSKPYGMDGAISTWFKDVSDDNVIFHPPEGSAYDRDTAVRDTGEHVYIYAGMRRGGRNYYGLDVTDRSAPELLFRIEGGSNTPEMGDFSNLGQTWSRMQIAKVKFNGDDKFVLFFTGGYDENQDSNSSTADDTMGNSIYMVDATTGKLMWSASDDTPEGEGLKISDMKNSIPASPSLVDHNGDGFVDYLFAADTGGRVFRLDINQNNTNAGNFAYGGMMASIASSGLAGKRRFYNKPNISLVKDSKLGDYLTISLGSGHRAHPKTTTAVENSFYVFKDRNPYSTPPTKDPENNPDGPPHYETVTLSTTGNLKLSNITAIAEGTSSLSTSLQSELSYGAGFYMELPGDAEKVLAESITFSGAVMFTTFKPNSNSNNSNSCGANTGESRLYALNLRTGQPILNLDNDNDLEASTALSHSGIAPRPVIIYREGGGKTIAVGTEAINDSRFEPKDPDDCPAGESCEVETKCETNNCYVTPLYWRQNDKN